MTTAAARRMENYAFESVTICSMMGLRMETSSAIVPEAAVTEAFRLTYKKLEILWRTFM